MLTLAAQCRSELRELLSRYAIELAEIPIDQDIPHSYWGNPEAGRLRSKLFARPDTPLHSILHEACHYICIPFDQRQSEKIDAGGSFAEENATCYLQIMLGEQLEDYSREIHFQDMDTWGYSFRLGSARRWFYEDAEDTQAWLKLQKLLTPEGQLSWQLRTK